MHFLANWNFKVVSISASRMTMSLAGILLWAMSRITVLSLIGWIYSYLQAMKIQVTPIRCNSVRAMLL